MIDIEKIEQEFKKYTNNYDMNEAPIARKFYHTFRVEELCEKVAILVGVNKEEVNLAKIIGLLHDIGRFEQHVRYKTYNDYKSIDHGDLGVEILKQDNYIRKYIETDKYDSTILKAIKNHNKYVISNDVTEEEKVFCKIIKDADKLDILFLASTSSWEEKKQDIIEQKLSKKVEEQFKEGRLIDNNNIQQDIDWIVRVIAFIYDFNFNGSYKIIKENKYIDKIIDRFDFKIEETKKQIEEIRKIANDYIDSKVKEEY